MVDAVNQLREPGMDLRILGLAFASFAMGTEAYVYAGHLKPMAQSLGSRPR